MNISPTKISASISATSIGAAALLGLAAQPVDDSVKLHFSPAAGSAVEHEITIHTEFHGGDLAVKMGGSDVPANFLPKLEFSLDSKTSATVSDEYLTAEEGIDGPWRKRTITDPSEAFTMEMSMDSESFDFGAEGTSELSGEPFFIGRDEDGETIARWADKDSALSTELLELQRPDCDLAGILTEDAVSTGDTWEADASALAGVLDFSRGLPWTWSGSDPSQVPPVGTAEWTGDLELTVNEIKGEGDEMHCTVSITGEAIEVVTKPGDLSQVPVADGTATETTTTTYQVEGEFTWNVTVGHLVALNLEGDGEGEQLTVKDAGQPGPEYQSTTQHTAKLSVDLK